MYDRRMANTSREHMGKVRGRYIGIVKHCMGKREHDISVLIIITIIIHVSSQKSTKYIIILMKIN